MDMTDQQWTIIEPLFEEKRRPDGRGRPWRDARAVLNGVLWVLPSAVPAVAEERRLPRPAHVLAADLRLRGKGNKIMAIVDRRSLPLAVHVACASPHEVRLVDATLEDRFIAPYPPRLIGDRPYDSNRLDAALWTSFGIELTAPHRDDRVRPTQDGRALRRYKRRWDVERFFAWLHNSRRLVTRWERHVENFVAMLAARMHARPAQPFMR